MFDIKSILLDLYRIAPLVSYFALFFIVFAESGLFFGFFLPGDSLLVTAGLLASQGFFDIKILLVSLAIAAVSGDSVGYWMGRKYGRKLFKRQSRYILKAEKFYQKHGGKAIIFARFVPVIRTFAPIAAGIAQMEYRKFLSYNIFGGLLWTWGMLLAGFLLGNTIPGIEHHLLTIIGIIVLVSLVPFLIELYKKHRQSRT